MKPGKLAGNNLTGRGGVFGEGWYYPTMPGFRVHHGPIWGIAGDFPTPSPGDFLPSNHPRIIPA